MAACVRFFHVVAQVAAGTPLALTGGVDTIPFPQPKRQMDGAIYSLEFPVQCPHCDAEIRTFKVFRLLRAQVSFTSTLPRMSLSKALPPCSSVASAIMKLSTSSSTRSVRGVGGVAACVLSACSAGETSQRDEPTGAIAQPLSTGLVISQVYTNGGNLGSSTSVDATYKQDQEYADSLMHQMGWRSEYKTQIYKGAGHNERAWAKQVSDAFRFWLLD